jgi:hypothetical protein
MRYVEFCEDLFTRWLEHRVQLSAWAVSKLPNIGADGEPASPVAFCPEPYLVFGVQHDRVAFLTANPGNGMWFQRREAVDSADGPLRTGSYRENAARLAQVYSGRDKHISAVASSRVQAMFDVARRLQPETPPEAAGFMQFELFPLHSRALDKSALPRLQAEIPEYLPALAEHLSRLPIVCAIAGACDPVAQNRLVRAFAAALGLDLQTSPFVVLQRRGDKPTVGLFCHRQDGQIRAISCSCPYNVLPGGPLRAQFLDALAT